jgi:hemin uptake protein HemP
MIIIYNSDMSYLFQTLTSAKDAVDTGSAASLAALPSDARYSSIDLLQGRNSAVIHHDQQIYILRLTAQNKLILTK